MSHLYTFLSLQKLLVVMQLEETKHHILEFLTIIIMYCLLEVKREIFIELQMQIQIQFQLILLGLTVHFKCKSFEYIRLFDFKTVFSQKIPKKPSPLG